MSYITSLGLANPSNCFPQNTIADFMIRAMELDEREARRLRALYRASGIDTRHSVLDDYGKTNHFSFYSNSRGLEPFPATHARLEIFRKHALALSARSVERCFAKVADVMPESITHLVVVSCTGMYAPGLDIDLIHLLKLRKDIQRTCINFMGCYAAFNALKLADSFCHASSEARVLVVCTELCSIHFQKEKTEDNLLANALFADGSATLLVEGRKRSGLNLRPVAFYCDVATEGENDMAWTVGNMGFEMKLSAYVPEIIRQGIGELTSRLLARISSELSDIKYFAIHPGGKKILEVIEKELGLTREQNQDAYEVLRRYGNMSSPTVLFVLGQLCSRLNGVDDGKKILSFAFGPGLTLESMVLSVENG
jgi:prepilin-type processing-associated H-X9-DG protein